MLFFVMNSVIQTYNFHRKAQTKEVIFTFLCITNGKKWLCILLAVILFPTGFYVFARNNEEEIPIPILMYHSILKDESKAGKYIVTPKTLENDFLYLKENHYNSITVSDLIAYVYEGVPLPENPIILTFDDGHYNNMVYLLPLLEKYEMKAVISVVGSYTDEFSKKDSHNPNYSYLTWVDVKQLHQTGRIEIANHTYNMHESSSRKGCSIKKGEKKEEYQKIFKEDLTLLQTELQQNSDIPAPLTFTYPFGFICQEAQSVLEGSGILASLSCYEKISKISKDPASLYCLGRFNRPNDVPTEKFMKKLVSH